MQSSNDNVPHSPSQGRLQGYARIDKEKMNLVAKQTMID